MTVHFAIAIIEYRVSIASIISFPSKLSVREKCIQLDNFFFVGYCLELRGHQIFIFSIVKVTKRIPTVK